MLVLGVVGEGGRGVEDVLLCEVTLWGFVWFILVQAFSMVFG